MIKMRRVKDATGGLCRLSNQFVVSLPPLKSEDMTIRIEILRYALDSGAKLVQYPYVSDANDREGSKRTSNYQWKLLKAALKWNPAAIALRPERQKYEQPRRNFELSIESPKEPQPTQPAAPAKVFAGAVYECVRCGTRTTQEELSKLPEVKCICGYRVFKKARPAVVKQIKAI